MKRYSLINEDFNTDWKDPYSANYNMLYAEDALYRTVGPLRPDAEWDDKPWQPMRSKITTPPPGYMPGGPAPTWTKEEVAAALVGVNYDKSQRNYVRNSWMYRLASSLGRIYKKSDLESVDEIYNIGVARLAYLMDSGRDAGAEGAGKSRKKTAFTSWITADIRQAMVNGWGKSKQIIDTINLCKRLKDIAEPPGIAVNAKKAFEIKLREIDNLKGAIGDSEYDERLSELASSLRVKFEKIGVKKRSEYSKRDLVILQNAQQDIKDLEEEISERFPFFLGLKTGAFEAINRARDENSDNTTKAFTTLLNNNNPSVINSIISTIGEKYRHVQDEDPDIEKTKDNPFAPYSALIYIYGEKIIDALERLKEADIEEFEYIQAAKNQKVKKRDYELSEEVREIKSELRDIRQALSSHMPKSIRKKVMSIDKPTGEDESSSIGSMLAGRQDTSGEREAALDQLHDVFADITQAMSYRPEGGVELKDWYQELSEQLKKETGGQKTADEVIGQRANQILSAISSTTSIALPTTLKKIDLGAVNKISSTLNSDKSLISPRELRVMLRLFGITGYYGRNTLRANLDVPREKEGWLAPGEDPEVDLVPSTGEIYYTPWARSPGTMNNRKITEDFAKETEECIILGIPHAFSSQLRADNKDNLLVALSTQIVSTTVASLSLKFLYAMALHVITFPEDVVEEGKSDYIDLYIFRRGLRTMLEHLLKVQSEIVEIPREEIMDLETLYTRYKAERGVVL